VIAPWSKVAQRHDEKRRTHAATLAFRGRLDEP
jgi:hypothetical protein